MENQMKTLAIIVCALTLLSNHTRAEERKLVWSDEFDYEGLPNSGKWHYEEGFVRNKELQYYMKARKENARVENGHLIIEARKERRPNPKSGKGPYDWQRDRKFIDYTSACLITRKKFEFTYGRVEVRAKMPRGGGMWPAIWTVGAKYGDLGDPAWPRCGEIDIMEYFGKYPHRIYANAHFANPKITDKAVHNSCIQEDGKITIQNPYDDFHVYAIEWDEKYIVFFVDDNRYASFRIDIAGKGPDNPFRKPHFLLLNLALGGSAGGKIDDAVLPQKYVIDYVRIYEPKTGQQTDSGDKK